jgi:probable rRNA maturation factor|tara:strand:- start:56 stop:484 length:429 start_codon:yes stop_codon:yes gene_type:complete
LSVSFHRENVSLNADEKLIIKWLTNSVNSLDYSIGELSFVFCSDDYLRKLNIKHLNQDYFTDVITFDYSKEMSLIGDVFISTERVKENAKLFNVSFNEELFRVIIHGVLHLCGFKDKTKEEKAEMRSKENDFLSLINCKTSS